MKTDEVIFFILKGKQFIQCIDKKISTVFYNLLALIYITKKLEFTKSNINLTFYVREIVMNSHWHSNFTIRPIIYQ